MEYTQLGRTGLTVSKAGFGGGGIGQVWGPTNEQEAIASRAPGFGPGHHFLRRGAGLR